MTNTNKKTAPELSGFTSVDDYLERDRFKIFLNIRAKGKCGKTHFLMTAPRPIAYYDIDASGRGTMDRMTPKQKAGVKVRTLRYDPNDRNMCMASWNGFLDSYDDVMSGSYFASVCIDTQDELLQLQRCGYFGTRRPTQFEYATPNMEFLSVFKAYHNYNKTLLVTTRMDKEYIRVKTKGRLGKVTTVSEWTGGYIAKGKTELEEYLPEGNIELYRFADDDKVRQFGMRVDKLRVGLGPELEGEAFEQPDDDLSFPVLMTEIFPDTEREDWK